MLNRSISSAAVSLLLLALFISTTTFANKTPKNQLLQAEDTLVQNLSTAAPSFKQQAYLKASNTGAGDAFGRFIAISGNTLVVGASDENSGATGVDGPEYDNSAVDSGAVYVFIRTASGWHQQAYIKASNTETNDRFGRSVAISGDTLVIGASSEDSNATGVNGDETDDSASNAGAAYVFTRTGGTWSQQAYLKASNTDAGDWFGRSVSIFGDTLVIGAEGEDSNATGVNGDQANNSASSSGAAYAFTRTNGIWSQQAYLKASISVDHGEIRFGGALAISGETLLVGARNADAAFVFTRTGEAWSQQAFLEASNTGAYGAFGTAVAISGETLVVGANYESSNATGVDGDEDNILANASGAAYVFTRNADAWSQQAYLKASNTEANDEFGMSVAITAGMPVVAALNEDSNARGVNGDETNNANRDAGAVYVFFDPIFANGFEDGF